MTQQSVSPSTPPPPHRKPVLQHRRLLLRRLLLGCALLVAVVGAYFVLTDSAVFAAPGATTEKSGPRVPPPASEAPRYLQRATRNASLDSGLRAVGNGTAPSPPPSVTALEARVDGVLRRRWPHSFGAAAASRPVRVRVATVANRVDSALCAEQASAVASGVNVTVVGYRQPYSHATRLQTYLDFAEKEGLDDADVVMSVDSDVLWTGMGLEDALAKFVAFSPASHAALWPAAVRAWEDYGENTGEHFLRRLWQPSDQNPNTSLLQLPPVLFSAERFCYWQQRFMPLPMCKSAYAQADYVTEVVRNGHSNMTAEVMTAFLNLHRQTTVGEMESAKVFLAKHSAESLHVPSPPRNKSDPFFYHSNAFGQHNLVHYLNGGGVLTRVWALRLYTEIVKNFTQTYRPRQASKKANNGWECDQSIHGPLYVHGRMFEAAQGLLDAAPVPGVAANRTRGFYGVPPGMVGLDRRSEFFLTAAGVVQLNHRNYMGTQYHQRYAGPLVLRVWWYIRWLCTWWLPGNRASVVRAGPATTASGCALTPLLIRRLQCAEDILRGYHVERDDDADVAVAPLVHVPGPSKQLKYSRLLSYLPWRTAARWSRTANATLFRVLESAEVEVWSRDARHYIPFFSLCPDVPYLR